MEGILMLLQQNWKLKTPTCLVLSWTKVLFQKWQYNWIEQHWKVNAHWWIEIKKNAQQLHLSRHWWSPNSPMKQHVQCKSKPQSKCKSNSKPGASCHCSTWSLVIESEPGQLQSRDKGRHGNLQTKNEKRYRKEIAIEAEQRPGILASPSSQRSNLWRNYFRGTRWFW